MKKLNFLFILVLGAFSQFTYAKADHVRHFLINNTGYSFKYDLRGVNSSPYHFVGELYPGEIKEINCEDDAFSSHTLYTLQIQFLGWISGFKQYYHYQYRAPNDAQLSWEVIDYPVKITVKEESLI